MSALQILSPISAEQQAGRGWKVDFNGKRIGYVEDLTLSHEQFGTFEYGNTPAGYDAWCFKEIGGGGSVIVPYAIIPHQPRSGRNGLYIGLVEQDRWTMGKSVWNVPRGFLTSGETHFQTAQREAGEELQFNFPERFVELSGEPANPNSAFFVTPPEEGVRFYSLHIKQQELVREGDRYKLKKDVLAPVSDTAERISRSAFFYYETALAVSDMFTIAGVGRLLGQAMPMLG